MIKTPLSTVIGGAGIWTPGCTVISSMQKTLNQLIKSLFSNSEVGFAYDPNDLTTLYQDAAGTIPVTSAGQPVGLMKDKSGRNNHAYQATSAARPLLRQVPILGGNYAVNGTFATDISGWLTYLCTAVKKDDGVLITATVAGNPQFSQNRPNAAGKTFIFSVSFKNRLGSAQNTKFTFYAAGYGDIGFKQSTESSGTLSFVATVPAGITNGVLICMMSNATTGASVEFSNVQMVEVTGYRTDQNYIEYDGVDDKLLTTFPSQLNNCTVIRSVPNIGTQILTNQTIPTPYNDSTGHCGLIVINRALTATETAQITRLFNKAAGV